MLPVGACMLIPRALQVMDETHQWHAETSAVVDKLAVGTTAAMHSPFDGLFHELCHMASNVAAGRRSIMTCSVQDNNAASEEAREDGLLYGHECKP